MEFSQVLLERRTTLCYNNNQYVWGMKFSHGLAETAFNADDFCLGRTISFFVLCPIKNTAPDLSKLSARMQPLRQTLPMPIEKT